MDEKHIRVWDVGDYWGKLIDPQKWFDPAFENFINHEIIKGERPAEGD